MSSIGKSAGEVLDTYRLHSSPLFFIGTFAKGITVYSQQVRALNLAWALVEESAVKTVIKEETNTENQSLPPQKIGIIGGGVAGMTLAAAFIAKGVDAKITIIEERDALLPIQQGSDTRWLHPRIYDWPKPQSNASVAMLPLLNWTAARASDVAMQMLEGWKTTLENSKIQESGDIRVFCNAKHVQVSGAPESAESFRVELVAEERNATDGMQIKGNSAPVGQSLDFDILILATGFGVENAHVTSYWRNDQLAQPSLHEPRLTYLVSGQGDGAMVDLLRLCISQFRQDRIHLELFGDLSDLKAEFEKLYQEHVVEGKPGLYEALEILSHEREFKNAQERLQRRLRRDTEVILGTKVKEVADLFDPLHGKMSFQNRILLFLLFRSGGFVPSTLTEAALKKRHNLPDLRIIRRYGVEPEKAILRVLKDGLDGFKGETTAQAPDILWPGGYFGYPGKRSETENIPDEVRKSWRREYLPGPTRLLAASLCAVIAGLYKSKHGDKDRMRITLHRTMFVGEEEWLQQCCDYEGYGAIEKGGGGGRTFDAKNALIGQAYLTQKILRSKKDATTDQLQKAMKALDLNATSREMSKDVSFLLAVPILEPSQNFTTPKPVAGVLFIDSTSKKFFLDDKDVLLLKEMLQSFVAMLEGFHRQPFRRISNVPLSGSSTEAVTAEGLNEKAKPAIEELAMEPPRSSNPLQLNFDHDDVAHLVRA